MRLELPNCIREELSEQRLPQWVIDIFDLDEISKISDLPSVLEVNSTAELKAMNHYVQSIINRRMNNGELKKKLCFPYSSLILDKNLIDALDLSVRTKNAFMTHWVIHESAVQMKDTFISHLVTEGAPIQISKITYEDLFRTPNMGAKSVLEFLYHMEKYGGNAKENSTEDENTIILNESIKKNIIKFKTVDDIDYIYKGDPRFTEINTLLPVVEYEKDNSLNDLITQSYNIYSQWPKSERYRLDEILEVTYKKTNLMNSWPLEKLFHELIESVYKSKKKSNLVAMYDRFGINDEGIKTLEECGQQAGVTRERIRQIESKILKGINNIPGEDCIYMPKLSKAINIIRSNIGMSVVDIQNKFIENKISKIGISVYSVLYFAKLLRYPIPNLKISKLGPNKEKVVIGGDINVDSIFTELSKLYSRNGIADLRLVQFFLKKQKTTMGLEEATKLLRASKEWFALDIDKRWWVPTNLNKIARNRLINVAKKVLSVNKSIDINDLRNGYIKLAIFRNSSGAGSKNKITVPSASVMLNFFDLVDGFVVDGNNITSNKNLDFREELAEVESTLADILIKSPTGIMSRNELLTGAIKQGINENSASLYISYSPIVQHIGSDTYTIIGKKPLASDYSAHKDAVSDKNKNKSKRILLCDWNEGLIRIVIRSPEVTANLVIGAPSSVKPLLSNQTFEAWDTNETERYANIGVSDQGAIYGMSSFCRHAGVEENDILVMRFNLLESKAYLSLGTIDEYLDIL